MQLYFVVRNKLFGKSKFKVTLRMTVMSYVMSYYDDRL